MPGVSEEADQKKARAKQTVYEKEYVRGSILDRNGKALAWSREPWGKRFYASKYANSSLIGYWSKIYGTSGLESKFNDLMTHSAAPEKDKRGADMTLTLDSSLQEAAYEQIKDGIGSVVILSAKTGEILALTSSPSYDADTLEDEWEEVNERDGVFLSNAFLNPVAPGSVFKLVTSKAILECGLEDKKVEDEGALKINGQTIRNYDGKAYGSLDWEQGFVKSSNVYFMQMALEMGGNILDDAAGAFLLGQDIDLDFATIRSSWDLADYEKNVVASAAFGQGSTLVTPLQMAMITQSIAGGGTMKKPYLIKSVVNAKDQVLVEGEEETLTKTMEPETAAKIRRVMTEAGESYGLSRIGDNCYKIAAKTGTAQRGDGTNNAWMVTFAPADDPQYIVVVNRLKTKEIGKSLAPTVELLYEMLLD